MKKILLIIIGIFVLVSCNNKSSNNKTVKQPLTQKLLNYATGFAVNNFEDYKEVIVFSPWKKGEIYARYYLVKDIKTKTPNDGEKIKIPLKTLASTSVTHLEFLSLLDEIQTITGVCSPALIYNSELQKKHTGGQNNRFGRCFQPECGENAGIEA